MRAQAITESNICSYRARGCQGGIRRSVRIAERCDLDRDRPCRLASLIAGDRDSAGVSPAAAAASSGRHRSTGDPRRRRPRRRRVIDGWATALRRRRRRRGRRATSRSPASPRTAPPVRIAAARRPPLQRVAPLRRAPVRADRATSRSPPSASPSAPGPALRRRHRRDRADRLRDPGRQDRRVAARRDGRVPPGEDEPGAPSERAADVKSLD